MALVLASVYGCSPAPAPPAPAPSGRPDQGRLTSCSVPLPASWPQTIGATRVSEPGATAVAVVATGPGAGVHFIKTTKGDRVSVVMVADGRRRDVTALPRGQDAFGFDFDGRWLTYGVGYDPRNPDDWAAFAWDSSGEAAPRQIATNRDGTPGPWMFTVVHQGMVAWVQGTRSGSGPVALHLFDLAAGRDRTVATGAVNNPVFFGDLLVWRKVDPVTKVGRFEAVSPHDGHRATLPPALREVTAEPQVAADTQTIVWTADSGRTLMAWRRDWPEARKIAEVVTGPDLPGIQFPAVAGDLVSWSAQISFVTDIRSGGTYRSTDAQVWLEIRGAAMTVQDGNARARGEPVASLAEAATLAPLGGC